MTQPMQTWTVSRRRAGAGGLLGPPWHLGRHLGGAVQPLSRRRAEARPHLHDCGQRLLRPPLHRQDQPAPLRRQTLSRKEEERAQLICPPSSVEFQCIQDENPLSCPFTGTFGDLPLSPKAGLKFSDVPNGPHPAPPPLSLSLSSPPAFAPNYPRVSFSPLSLSFLPWSTCGAPWCLDDGKSARATVRVALSRRSLRAHRRQ